MLISSLEDDIINADFSGEKLLALCGDKNYSIFYGVIRAIADSHGTVEQECFLLDDNMILV